MGQNKDNVKKIVGGSLNLYHQDIKDGIDEVTKEKDKHAAYINALSKNANDNILTIKDVQDNSILLENSIDGQVYIDSLKGNTLVNVSKTKDAELLTHSYPSIIGNEGKLEGTTNDEIIRLDAITGHTLVNRAIDGEEIVLNDKINETGIGEVIVDGTVDGGKVDVVLEGNTLVNLMFDLNTDDKYYTFTAPNDWRVGTYTTDAKKIKPNTKYTLIVDIAEWTLSENNNFYVSVDYINQNAFVEHVVFTKTKGIHIVKLTSKSEIFPSMFVPRQQIELKDDGYVKYRMILLEGDYTDKEIPEYFEGMKSVGELEDNSIKIKSTNCPVEFGKGGRL